MEEWPEMLGSLIAREARKSVLSAMERVFESGQMDKVIWDKLWQHPRFRFIKWGQMELQRVCPTMPDKTAYELSRNTLDQFLADEKCQIGDPRFGWDKASAIELVRAYEIEYWDEAA